MRAKFIYEKFTADSDPIKDMGIGLEQLRKQYIHYTLDHVLTAMFGVDYTHLRKAFGINAEYIFFLGINKELKTSKKYKYLNQLKRLEQSGQKIYEETYDDDNTGELSTLTVYETPIGKLGKFTYSGSSAVQYFGEINIFLTLKTDEVLNIHI